MAGSLQQQIQIQQKPSLFSSTSTGGSTSGGGGGQAYDSISLGGGITGPILRNDSLSSDPMSEYGLLLPPSRPSPSHAMLGSVSGSGTAGAYSTGHIRGGGGSSSSAFQPSHASYHIGATTSATARPRLRDGRRLAMYKSLSSSEDEMRSMTPELSTEEDFDLDSCALDLLSDQGPGTASSAAAASKNLMFMGGSVGGVGSAAAAGGGAGELGMPRKLKPDDILDAKMRNFLVVSAAGGKLFFSSFLLFL